MRSKTKDRRGRDLVRATQRRLERLRLLAAMMPTQPLMSQQGREIDHNAESGGPAVQPAPVAPAAPPPGPAHSPSASGDAGSTRRADPEPGRDAGVALRLLGAPQLVRGNKSSSLERRTAALLALLVLQGPTPRARAAALVWPEADETRANNSLRQRIYKLRQAAGRDVIASDRHIALAVDITHDLGAPLTRLAEDAEACGGELLGELDYTDCGELADWVALARQRWRAELAHALAELASRQETEGRIAGALRLAERLVALEPTAEHAHRRVMRLHYLRGDRAAALNAFERCRQVLRSELGVLPDAETQRLQQLIESSSASAPARAAPPQPVSMLRPPRLVGRDAEWQRLQRAMDERHTVLVVGEAGVGKSRLLADFATAHAGMVVSARPGDAGVPYASLARLLRAVLAAVPALARAGATHRDLAYLLPELGEQTPGPFNALRLRAAVQALQQALADSSPALRLLALDDAQFADAATLEILPALAAAALPPLPSGSEIQAKRGPCWLLASRPGDLPAALRAWVGAEDTGALGVQELRPLSEEGVRALLESLALPEFDAARWAAALHRHTGGNPMFVLETLRSLIQRRRQRGATVHAEVPATLPSPEDVGSLIERRLAQLDPEALNLARVAALAGQDFTPELAAKVLERRVIDLAAPWAELESAHIFREQAFAHDLVLEAVQRTVPAAVGRALHRAIADRLEVGGAAAARIASHRRAAGEVLPAARAYARAAQQARRATQQQLEAELWLEAGRLFDEAGAHDEAFAALATRTEAVQAVQSQALAQVAVEALITRAATPAQRAVALATQSHHCVLHGQWQAAADAGREAIALAEATGQPAALLKAARMRALALIRLGDAATALAELEAREPLVSPELRRDAPLEAAQFLSDGATVLEHAGRRRRAVEMRAQALALYRQESEFSGLLAASSNQAATLGQLGRFREALAHAQTARSLIERTQSEGGLFAGHCLTALGLMAGTVGEYRSSVDALEAACALLRQAGQETWRHSAENYLAFVLVFLGQHARAQQVIAEEQEVAYPLLRARRIALRGRIARALGGRGRADFERALAVLEPGPASDGVRMATELELSRELPAEDALALCRQVERRAAETEYEAYALHARWMQVPHLGNAQAAADLALDLLAAVRGSQQPGSDAQVVQPADFYLPEAGWLAYHALRRAGRCELAAEEALRRAYDWIHRVALPTVPEPFRESFLHRNAVNRAVLAAASREGMTPPPQADSQ